MERRGACTAARCFDQSRTETLNGRRAITDDAALRPAHFFGATAEQERPEDESVVLRSSRLIRADPSHLPLASATIRADLAPDGMKRTASPEIGWLDVVRSVRVKAFVGRHVFVELMNK